MDGFFNKVELLINEMETKIKSGFIDFNEEYIFKNKIIKDFNILLNSNLMSYIPIKNIALKKDFEDMFNNSFNDIVYEIDNYEKIKNLIETLNYELSTKSNKVDLSFNYIDELILKTKNKQLDDYQIITENFKRDNIDLELIKTEPLKVNFTKGILTLNFIDEEKIEDFDIFIDDSSIGFPGNTKEASFTNKKINFLGDENLNINLNNIKTKNDIFTFENINVVNIATENEEDFNFLYKENIDYNSNYKKCELKLIIKFKEKVSINNIYIKPILASILENDDLIITQLFLTNKQGKYKDIIIDPIRLFDLNYFIFDEQETKEIKITLLQENGYFTNIGHLYSLLESFDTGTNYSLTLKENFFSCKYLGVEKDKYDNLIFPSTLKNVKFSEEKIKEHFFSKPLDDDYKKYKYNLIPVIKYNISVDEISINNINFNDEGEYISLAYAFEDGINSIELKTDEFINGNIDYDKCFEYYITYNDGKDYLKINPLNRFKNGQIIKIVFDSDIETEVINNNPLIQIIEVNEIVEAFRLKVILKKQRNEDSIFIPILKQYNLIVK